MLVTFKLCRLDMNLIARDVKNYLLFQLCLCCDGKWLVFACFVLQYQNFLKVSLRTLVNQTRYALRISLCHTYIQSNT